MFFENYDHVPGHVWQRFGPTHGFKGYQPKRQFAQSEKRLDRPEKPPVGYTGFYPRKIKQPDDKTNQVDADVKRPEKPMPGFSGFVPKFKDEDHLNFKIEPVKRGGE